jgi:hypothetical protein
MLTTDSFRELVQIVCRIPHEYKVLDQKVTIRGAATPAVLSLLYRVVNNFLGQGFLSSLVDGGGLSEQGHEVGVGGIWGQILHALAPLLHVGGNADDASDHRPAHVRQHSVGRVAKGGYSQVGVGERAQLRLA